MKRIFIIAAVFTASVAHAQESHLFVRAGANMANVTISENGSYNDANALFSFHAGVTADLPLSRFVSLQPSLLFTGKGAKVEYGEATGSNPTYFKSTSSPYYIELPVNILGKIPLAMDESSFFIGAGPYIAAGVAGKNKSKGQIIGNAFSSENKIEFSSSESSSTSYEERAGLGTMKRFDYGLNATAGFQFNSIMISANYGYGLANIAPGSDSDNGNDINKHRVVSLSLGVRL